MRDLEASLQQFGEFLLKARLVKEKSAPYCVRWVRRFLTRPASDEPVADQVRRFCEDLEREGRWEEWQVRQAKHALRIYFVNFLRRTDWHRTPVSTVVDERGHASPLASLEQLRQRLRTRHYSYRTECSYADWVRRFFAYLAERQGVPHPRVTSETCGTIRAQSVPTLLTTDEVAATLRTSRKAIYAMIERQLPGIVRIGRRVLVRQDALLDWLRQKSTSSLER
jgi:excisionase family DNA binding protein